MQSSVRNPLEWTWESLKRSGQAVGSTVRTLDGAWEDRAAIPIVIRRIGAADLGDALAKGLRDFGACRTDIALLGLFYPIAGLLISRMAFDYGMAALVFPMIAGFALVAPVFGIGLYEISRRREQGLETRWTDAFAVVRSPAIGSIRAMALLLFVIFCLWLFAANFIYTVTLGPEEPLSAVDYARDALTTPEGWSMTIVGTSVGFLFALGVLVISVVSFPLMLDRRVGVGTAIATSARAIAMNPGPMALWGLTIAASLALGAIPLLLGFAIALPVLAHATWHLYRKVVKPPFAAR